MRDNAELVKALLYCSDISDFRGCLECIYERKCRAYSRDRACINQPFVMVDAADAIEELLARDVVPTDFHERCLQLEIRKRIELEKQMPHWISVEDEPPNEKGDYWCNVRSYNFDDTYYQHEVWFDGESFVIDGVCTDRVTHWMPLPEAPKEDTP